MMKRKIILLVAAVSTLYSASAQQVEQDEVENPYAKYIENGVVPMADKTGVTFKTKAGDLLFKPYLLIQSMAECNYYDDDGLNLADQDNLANSGFSIPNAIVGFSGQAFNKITFNITLNASQTGAALLQQAWFDVNFNDEFRIRTGKFKTPFQHAYLTTLGQTLFPSVPSSVTTAVRTNMSLDSVQPSLYTGFDLGIELHGVIKSKFGYEVGIFNGTGITTNSATNGTSDDYKGLPSLLYAGRFSYMPNGQMPTHQGDPSDLNSDKMVIAASLNYNVEGNSESSDDLRAGVEFAWIKNKLYFAAEAYMLHMMWTQRMMRDKEDNFTAWGAYAQAGYFVTNKVQAALRYDLYDRNGVDTPGLLNMPAVGANYFFAGNNLKLQVMYQYIGKMNHETQTERDNDDTGMPYHSLKAMLQFTF